LKSISIPCSAVVVGQVNFKRKGGQSNTS
jgi:hypothetical protein